MVALGRAGHVDAAGAVTRFALPGWADDYDDDIDVAVSPDGTAWFTTGRCALMTATRGASALARVATPIPARRIGFAPDGTRWLASVTTLVRGDVPGAVCDDVGPHARASATRLRYARFAAGGLTLDLDEPARFYFNAGTSDRWIQVHLDGTGVHYAYRPAATVRREIKRRLDHGRRVRLRYSLNAYDADGNFHFNPGILEITR